MRRPLSDLRAGADAFPARRPRRLGRHALRTQDRIEDVLEGINCSRAGAAAARQLMSVVLPGPTGATAWGCTDD
jgi:hypothetical protein